MNIIPVLIKEMEQEAVTTRKMLSRIPDDKYDWKPHEKSMSVRQLATHIAELPGWVSMVLHTTELDFETNPYNPEKIDNTEQLLAYFEKILAQGLADLKNATEDDLLPEWTLRMGATILSKDPRLDVLRMAYCQIVHHRAQLGVYLRLLNIPIPGSYGPSADDNMGF